MRVVAALVAAAGTDIADGAIAELVLLIPRIGAVAAAIPAAEWAEIERTSFDVGQRPDLIAVLVGSCVRASVPSR